MPVTELSSELAPSPTWTDKLQGTLELATPDEKVESILHIDFKELVAKGITTLLLDAESTFVENDGWKVNKAVIRKIEEARACGIQNIAIISNNRPVDDTGWTKIAWWGRQIGADRIFTPILLGDRKPSEVMIERALRYFEVAPEQAAMVGDKASADIVAGNRAGVYTIWTDRLGRRDLAGDFLFRRPLEAIWKYTYPRRMARREGSGQPEVEGHLFRDRPPLAAINKSLPPVKLAKLDLIDGFRINEGGEVEEVDIEAELFEQIIAAEAELGWASAKFYEYMKKNGGTVADVLTLARIPLGVLVCRAIMKEDWKKAAFFHLLAIGTDFLDGKAAGLSEESKDSDNRKRGGKWDEQIDKAYSASVGLALALKNRKEIPDFALQNGRDLLRVMQRRYYEKHHPELDLRATMSGKLSTASLGVADFVAMLLPEEEHADIRDKVQKVATGLKIFSFFESPGEWYWGYREKKIGKRIMAIMTSEQEPDLD